MRKDFTLFLASSVLIFKGLILIPFYFRWVWQVCMLGVSSWCWIWASPSWLSSWTSPWWLASGTWDSRLRIRSDWLWHCTGFLHLIVRNGCCCAFLYLVAPRPRDWNGIFVSQLLHGGGCGVSGWGAGGGGGGCRYGIWILAEELSCKNGPQPLRAKVTEPRAVSLASQTKTNTKRMISQYRNTQDSVEDNNNVLQLNLVLNNLIICVLVKSFEEMTVLLLVWVLTQITASSLDFREYNVI